MAAFVSKPVPQVLAQAYTNAWRSRAHIDHDRRRVHRFGRKPFDYLGEHPHLTPTFPAVVECVGPAVFLRCVAPAQPIAIDEYYPAQNATIIDPSAASVQRTSESAPCVPYCAPLPSGSLSRVKHPSN